MYLKEFEIRWCDIDANRHLGNTAYINYISHTRMAFFNEIGLSQKSLADLHIGPVVFYEHIYYFKEVFPGNPVKVSLELVGLSEDGMFFEFHHNFYDGNGKNFAHCEIMGAWIDTNTRTLTRLNEETLKNFNKVEKSAGFRTLTKEDTRKYAKKPIDLV